MKLVFFVDKDIIHVHLYDSEGGNRVVIRPQISQQGFQSWDVQQLIKSWTHDFATVCWEESKRKISTPCWNALELEN